MDVSSFGLLMHYYISILYICYESDEGIKILRNSQRERLTSDSLFSTCNALRLFDGSFIFFPFDS
jgi:hypothetical protein